MDSNRNSVQGQSYWRTFKKRPQKMYTFNLTSAQKGRIEEGEKRHAI